MISVAKVFAAGNISLSDSSVTSVIEGNNEVFTFDLKGPSYYSYRYFTSDGTALEGKDYVNQADSLDFSCQETRACPTSIDVTVPTIDNSVYEPGADRIFSITVISNNNDGGQDEIEGTWTASIKDNDPAPAPTPPATTTPTPTPPPPIAPTPVITPRPRPHPIPAPTPDPVPTPAPDPQPTTPAPQVLADTNVIPPTPPAPQPPQRSVFVKSVSTPKELGFHAKDLLKSAIIAAVLILLIMFPADLFNSTLQSNYDEVVGWFKLDYVSRLHHKLQLHRMPIAIVLTIFAGLVTLLNVQLSPGMGFNRASGALLLGMFAALTFAAAVYDLSRSWYLKKRFGIDGKLRTHALGLGAGALFVTVSRLAHFVPGYLYGLFTGLIFKQKEPTDKQDGEGLALASVVLLFIAVLGWFALIPVRSYATQPNASFVSLVAESALASLWVSALGTIVFSLAPLRFMYGEQVKKWNKVLWAALWGTGMLLFVYTLLDPNQGIYSKSSTASWISVLSLFIGFGIFSFAFWGYFRFRPVRPQPIAQITR